MLISSPIFNLSTRRTNAPIPLTSHRSKESQEERKKKNQEERKKKNEERKKQKQEERKKQKRAAKLALPAIC